MRIVAFITSAVLAAGVVTAARADAIEPAAIELPGDIGTVPSSAYGSLFRSVFGDRMERDYSISVLGWAEGSLIATGNDPGETLLPKAFGKNTPAAKLLLASRGRQF